jgi:hypothetical protein
MTSLENVSFTVASLGLVISLAIFKRKKTKKTASCNDLSDFLDWIDAESELGGESERGFLSPIEGPNSPVASAFSGDHTLFRSLASVGLAPTAPAQARNPKTDKLSKGSVAHPATGNEEIADDVVKLERISEAEESDRYFSAFSFYSSDPR